MKLLTMILLLPVTVVAVTVTPLPPSEYADTEVSTNIPFAVDFAAMSRMNFTVSLDASSSNSVEVSIGEDANGDGNLSLEEADQAFGYNCGKWFQRDSTAELFDCSDCSVVRLGRTERAEKTFVLKKRRLDEAWNLVKVTRRGKTEVCELATVEGAKPSAALIVR